MRLSKKRRMRYEDLEWSRRKCDEIINFHNRLCSASGRYISDYHIDEIRAQLNVYLQRSKYYIFQMEAWIRAMQNRLKRCKKEEWLGMLEQFGQNTYAMQADQSGYFRYLSSYEVKKEMYKEYWENHHPEQTHDTVNLSEEKGEAFFKGVRNLEELEKRYKQLMKMYHPDNAGGDTETAALITAAYQKLKNVMQ